MSLENLPKFLLNFSESEMRGEKRHSYRFEAFRLEVEERQLLHHDHPVPLTPKAFDVLVALVEQSGHLVEKVELLRRVWCDSFVEEANIARIVHTLRKKLGTSSDGNKFIETVAKKGYRFVAEVQRIEEGAETIYEEITIRPEPKQNPPGFSQRVKQIETQIFGNVVALANRRRETDKNETAAPVFTSADSAQSAEQTAGGRSALTKTINPNAVIKTQNDGFSQITKRRRGLRRGLKFFLYGLGFGFFFLIFQQVLMISSVLLLNDKNGLLLEGSKELAVSTVNLLILIQIPVGLGIFVGLGLFLFGIARIVYALFEKETSKINPVLIERLMVGVILLLLLAIAIPNLIFSYREAHRPKQSPPIPVESIVFR
jgi:DNA-binding winged helix-turn-helix (wHTH) protein